MALSNTLRPARAKASCAQLQVSRQCSRRDKALPVALEVACSRSSVVEQLVSVAVDGGTTVCLWCVLAKSGGSKSENTSLRVVSDAVDVDVDVDAVAAALLVVLSGGVACTESGAMRMALDCEAHCSTRQVATAVANVTQSCTFAS